MATTTIRFSDDDLRDRWEDLLEGEPLLTLLEPWLVDGDHRVPGRGWLVVTFIEAADLVAFTTLRDHDRLEALSADLNALDGRMYFDAADLRPEQHLPAARIDAVLGLEVLGEVAERYQVDVDELTDWEDAVPSEEGIPEVVLGTTLLYRCAG